MADLDDNHLEVLITNIENAPGIISGIEKIEVLEKPVNGLVGLKWRETRMPSQPRKNGLNHQDFGEQRRHHVD